MTVSTNIRIDMNVKKGLPFGVVIPDKAKEDKPYGLELLSACKE